MYYAPMSATVNLRLNEALHDFVQRNVGEHGAFDNVSEFIRHTIRKEQEWQESQDFLRVKRELEEAFAQDPAEAVPLDANSLRAELFGTS